MSIRHQVIVRISARLLAHHQHPTRSARDHVLLLLILGEELRKIAEHSDGVLKESILQEMLRDCCAFPRMRFVPQHHDIFAAAAVLPYLRLFPTAVVCRVQLPWLGTGKAFQVLHSVSCTVL